MTSLPHCHAVMLPLTDISIKLLEYRSKRTWKAKIEQKLLNKKRQNTLHMCVWSTYVCLLSAIIMELNISGSW